MKKIVKNIVFFCSYLVCFNTRSKILFYHDIHKGRMHTPMSTSLDLFKKHISILKEQDFKIVNIISTKNKEILLQFDDGFRGIIDCLPYLESEKIFVEIFIITSRIGREGYLTEEELKILCNSEYVKVSAHTHTHKDLTELSQEELEYELKHSKYILESLLGTKVDSLCYPRGLFSKNVAITAKSLGYKKQYSSLPGDYFNVILKTVFKRYLVQHASPFEFKITLFGAQNLFYNRYLKRHFKQ